MRCLNIETSTTTCSVAITDDEQVVEVLERQNTMEHSALLPSFIQQLLKQYPPSSIQAVAVSNGPGSYTGLRVGLSTAKGLCMGLNVPLYVLDTLQILCVGVNVPDDGILCPMIDARRMEVYTAFYQPTTLQQITPLHACVVNEETFGEPLATKQIYFFGTGVEKCKGVITSPNAHFIDGIYPSAKNMGAIVMRSKPCEDIAYIEPIYVKEFTAIKGTIKGLR